MRATLVIIIAAGLAWLGWHLSGRTPTDLATVASSGADHDVPTHVISDGVEIFQKAFWKRPGEKDEILHAERREWLDGDGVRKWQWFLVVKPSSELVKHLREDNAFNLEPQMAPASTGKAPDWFRYDPARHDVMTARQGNLTLAFAKDASLLYATDHGGGFRAGVKDARPAVVHSASVNGRLPASPPPTP